MVQASNTLAAAASAATGGEWQSWPIVHLYACITLLTAAQRHLKL